MVLLKWFSTTVLVLSLAVVFWIIYDFRGRVFFASEATSKPAWIAAHDDIADLKRPRRLRL